MSIDWEFNYLGWSANRLEIKQRPQRDITFLILTFIFIMAAKKLNFYGAAKNLSFYGKK